MADVKVVFLADDQISKVAKQVATEMKKTTDAIGEGAKKSALTYTELKSKIELTAQAVQKAGQLMKAAYDFGKLGAGVQQATESFASLIGGTQEAARMLDELRRASNNTVDDMGLMGATTRLVAGTTGEVRDALVEATPKLLALAKAAAVVDPQLGSTEFAFQSLATGIKRGSPLLIDNTNVVISAAEAYESYAKSIGKNAQELTKGEQTLALTNATVAFLPTLLEQAGGSAEGAADSFAKLEASTKNLKNNLATAFAPAIAKMVDGLNVYFEGPQAISSALREQAAAAKEAGISVEEFTATLPPAVQWALTFGIGEDAIVQGFSDISYASADAAAAVDVARARMGQGFIDDKFGGDIEKARVGIRNLGREIEDLPEIEPFTFGEIDFDIAGSLGKFTEQVTMALSGNYIDVSRVSSQFQEKVKEVIAQGYDIDPSEVQQYATDLAVLQQKALIEGGAVTKPEAGKNLAEALGISRADADAMLAEASYSLDYTVESINNMLAAARGGIASQGVSMAGAGKEGQGQGSGILFPLEQMQTEADNAVGVVEGMTQESAQQFELMRSAITDGPTAALIEMTEYINSDTVKAIGKMKQSFAQMGSVALGVLKKMLSLLQEMTSHPWVIEVEVQVTGDDLPQLAHGGFAQGGKAHIVGERGPELFVPSASGIVIPNNIIDPFIGGNVTTTPAPDAQGMSITSGAPVVNVYLDGEIITDRVSVRMGQQLRAARASGAGRMGI